MTIHVNIGEAKTRLSELVAAAVRGEDVVLDKAGVPQARLIAVAAAHDAERELRLERRRSAIGMWAEQFKNFELDLATLKQDRDPERRERKAVEGHS